MAVTAESLAGNQAGIRELVQRIIFVLVALLVYRIGTHVPIPGMNPDQVRSIFEQQQGGVLDLFNMFSGGALERMSVLALGVVPYITSSIIMNLLTMSTPSLRQLRKDGEAGRRKITQYTRYGALAVAMIQGMALSVTLNNSGATYFGGWQFLIVGMIALTCGSMFMMWLGEQITERGVGNGMSLLIFAGIVAGFPRALGGSLEQARQGDTADWVGLLLALAVALIVVGAVVYIESAQRRITINFARRQQGRRVYQAPPNHLPLKINMAGVIPAIFASSLLLAPASMAQWFGNSPNAQWLQQVAHILSPGQPLYIILFIAGIVFFSFFYTALSFDPKDIAENLRRQGAYLPGIRPGQQTSKYIDDVMSRLTVFGSIYVALVCLLPEITRLAFNTTFRLGGTALLIVVVVSMDFMAQVQAHLQSSQYSKLMEKANLKNYGSAGSIRRT